MATNTEYEELVKGLSKEELTAFKYVCDVLDFASTVNKKSYVLETLNTTCSSLDTLTTGSRIVFDKDSKTIAVEVAGEIVKTITYESEMVGVRTAAGLLVRSGFSEADPWSASMGLVSGAGVYIIGSQTAEKFAEQAGVEAKELVLKLIEKYIEKEDKPTDVKAPSTATNITKDLNTNTLTKQTISLDDKQAQNSEDEALKNEATTSFANRQGIKKVNLDNETYTIQKGDTLLEIAKENNTTLDKLIENNPWLTEDNRISEDKSYALIKSGEKLNLTGDNKTTSYGIDENGQIVQKEVILLKEGQSISHIAQKTPYNSIELLEYNNLSLEEAKSLPIGFKVKIPKEKAISIEGEYGTIKLFENHDNTFTARFVDEKYNKTNITYSEDSDLLIYGDRTNPSKITFTDKETFQSWERDDKGIMYLKEIFTDEFDISFKILDGKKVLDSIEIKTDKVSLEKIVKYTKFSKEELKEFNHLESDTLNKDSNLQIPVSKKEIEGGYGDITQYTIQDGEYIFIVPNSDNTTTTYATFTDGFNENGVYRKEVA